ncbi:hypothetical protein BDN70DRAFT_964064 [Pholiota conissans]|uniref:Mid2 domain-containing protein n=1 Tax=Pholiota conissans TaxID=109636 RepID=A0A9P6CNN1_9AGAR|nr:hypothetical protein BDN70DRAFT_964064 [Pholiota conissans]
MPPKVRFFQLRMILCFLLSAVAMAATLDIISARVKSSQDFSTHASSSKDTIEVHLDPAPDGFNNSLLYFASVSGKSPPLFLEDFLEESGFGEAQDTAFDIPECPSGMYVLNLMDVETNNIILVSPEILVSNPGVSTTTTNKNFIGATTVASKPASTVLATSTSSNTTLSSSTNTATDLGAPLSTTTSRGRKNEILAIAISSTLGGTLILILLAGLMLRRCRGSTSAATQPFDSLPSITSPTSSWPPLLRVPAEKLESKFPSVSLPQAPVLLSQASIQEPARSSQNLDVIARLQEHIRYLEEVRDLEIGPLEQFHPGSGGGASVEDPPPDYPETASADNLLVDVVNRDRRSGFREF